VPYDNHSYQNLQLVSRYFDNVFWQSRKSLLEQIVQQQFLHLRKIQNAIPPGITLDWHVLSFLHRKSQHLEAWVELLAPVANRHVVIIGIVLIDVICSLRMGYFQGSRLTGKLLLQPLCLA